MTCDSMTDDPRTIYAIPLPCCQPCPCLQPCTTKNICCPYFGVQTDSESHLEASHGISTPKVQITHSGVTESTDLSNPSVEPETLYENTSILAKQQDKQLEFDNSNPTDEVQSSTDASILVQENTRPIALCEQPQVFHNPNYWIDSKAYMMVKYCWQGNMIVDKCYGDHVGKGISDMLPITSKRTGLTYWNKFCFICNEGDINDTVAEVWDAIIVDYRINYNHRFFHNPDMIVTDIENQYQNSGYSNIHFVPKRSTLARQCEAYDIVTCNKTGLWETYNENIENVCHEGHHLPILHRIDYDKLRFKNIACLYCNVDSSFNTDTALSCAYYPPSSRKKYSYSLTMNTGIGGMYKSTKDDRDISRSILPLPNTGACPTGYISLLVTLVLHILLTYAHYTKLNVLLTIDFIFEKGIKILVNVSLLFYQILPHHR